MLGISTGALRPARKSVPKDVATAVEGDNLFTRVPSRPRDSVGRLGYNQGQNTAKRTSTRSLSPERRVDCFKSLDRLMIQSSLVSDRTTGISP